MSTNGGCRQHKKGDEKGSSESTFIETNITNSIKDNLSIVLGEELINLIDREDFYLSKGTIDMINNVH